MKTIKSNSSFRIESKVKPLQKSDLLEISGREWFDRINGNRYYCVYILINNRLVITVPYTYGYDDSYIQSATEALKESGIIDTGREMYKIDAYCRDNDIHCVCHIQMNCKKKQLAK